MLLLKGSEKVEKGFFSDSDQLKYLSKVNKHDTMLGCLESIKMLQGTLTPQQKMILKSWYSQSRKSQKKRVVNE